MANPEALENARYAADVFLAGARSFVRAGGFRKLERAKNCARYRGRAVGGLPKREGLTELEVEGNPSRLEVGDVGGGAKGRHSPGGSLYYGSLE